MSDIQVGARVTWARSRFAESVGNSMSGIVRAIVVDDDGYEYAVVETDQVYPEPCNGVRDGHVTMPELSRLRVEGEEP